MQRRESVYYTVKVTPQVWNSYPERVVEQAQAALQKKLVMMGLELVPDSFRQEVLSTMVLGKRGPIRFPGEVVPGPDEDIMWYHVAYLADGYEPLKVEFEFKDK